MSDTDPAIATPDALPPRQGPAPQVEPGPPQCQLDQLPDAEIWQRTRAIFEDWSAETGPSLRAAPGTLGLFLSDADQGSDEERHFLIGREFAHHHPDSDGGLHLVLPEPWCAAVIDKGWGMAHTWAGRPTVSDLTVLVYAPRDETELAVIRRLVEVSQSLARGA